jgi:multiple sugar transport system permease protein
MVALGTRQRRRVENSLLYVSLAAVTVFFVVPVLWAVSTSLKDVTELFARQPIWFPPHPRWTNYLDVVERTPLLRSLLNSTVLVAGTVLATLLVALPAAYALSRFKFRGRRTYLTAALAGQLISPMILVVPLYRLFASLGLLNGYLSLVLVYVAVQLPFTTWFLKEYIDTVPIEIDEAAEVDGCGKFGAAVRIVLPAATPGVVSAAVIVAVQSWSQFIIPFVLLDRPELFPISVGVVNLQSTTGEITTQYLAAGSVIAVLPVVIVFVALQRYIVSGLTQGAVK